MSRALFPTELYLGMIRAKDAIVLGILYAIAVVLLVMAAPFIIIYYIVRWCIDIRRMGWRLAWNKSWNHKKYKKWEGLKKAKEIRIDKELNGWPEDPIERAKCPRLNLKYDNMFECNGYIEGSSHSLIYVANEQCPELEEIFESRIDELNQWAAPMGFQVVYIPSVFKTLKDEEVQKYRNPGVNTALKADLHVGSDYMLRFLIHPEDREKMRHGLYFYQSEDTRNDHYVKTYICHYYELLPPSERNWDEQLKAIKKRLYGEVGWLMPHLDKTSGLPDGLEPDDYADNHFNSQEWCENINDLTEEIRERVKILRQRGVAEHILSQLIQPEEKVSRLVITQDYRLLLPDYQDMEIKMEPLVKAVFLLFLNHPEGIRFKELPDYCKELTEIYLRLKPNGLTERVRKSIEDVTSPTSNSINEKCARIRGAFVGQFDNHLAKHYYIDGARGKPKKIALPRELVVWE